MRMTTQPMARAGGLIGPMLLGFGLIAGAWALQPGTTEPETPVQSDPELAEFVREVIGAEGPPEIDAVIDEVYAVISGPAGERDWDRFRELFAQGATMISIQPNGGRFTMGVEAFIKASAPIALNEPFYERELTRRVEVFGNLAHVWSTYASSRDPAGEPFSRGINSLQLVRGFTDDGPEWKIASIVWQVEGDTLPIPKRYLPSGARPSR